MKAPKSSRELARDEVEKVNPGGVEQRIKKAQTLAMIALVEAIEKLADE